MLQEEPKSRASLVDLSDFNKDMEKKSIQILQDNLAVSLTFRELNFHIGLGETRILGQCFREAKHAQTIRRNRGSEPASASTLWYEKARAGSSVPCLFRLFGKRAPSSLANQIKGIWRNEKNECAERIWNCSTNPYWRLVLCHGLLQYCKTR